MSHSDRHPLQTTLDTSVAAYQAAAALSRTDGTGLVQERLVPRVNDVRTDADRWDQALLHFAEAIAVAIVAELENPPTEIDTRRNADSEGAT